MGLCLLCASSTPRRVGHDRDRPAAEITAVKALAKVAVRRDDWRPVHALGLDVFAPRACELAHEGAQICIELVHPSPARPGVATRITSTARGPPLG